MIKNYKTKCYSPNTEVNIHDSFNGQFVMDITEKSGNRITGHQTLYLDRENVRSILDDMDKEAQDD